MSQRLCECEHRDHFEILTVERGVETVGPATKHAYGHAPATQDVGTTYGSFHVCDDCATICLRGIV